MTKVRCAVCGAEVYRDAKGRILMHTTAAMGGERPARMSLFDPGMDYVPAKVCDGSSRGARA